MSSEPATERRPAGDVSKADLAAQAWRPIIAFIADTGPRRSGIFGELGLTPNDGRALASLEPEVGRPMRSLAREWGCDASTATWAVDRLEGKGLAERRADPNDRRVRLVVLTEHGARLRDELRVRMQDPPPELLQLRRSELIALRDAASRLPRPAWATAPSGTEGAVGRPGIMGTDGKFPSTARRTR
jgi:DNA-binding MarR family transcriptional regulator